MTGPEATLQLLLEYVEITTIKERLLYCTVLYVGTRR